MGFLSRSHETDVMAVAKVTVLGKIPQALSDKVKREHVTNLAIWMLRLVIGLITPRREKEEENTA